MEENYVIEEKVNVVVTKNSKGIKKDKIDYKI